MVSKFLIKIRFNLIDFVTTMQNLMRNSDQKHFLKANLVMIVVDCTSSGFNHLGLISSLFNQA